MKLKRSSQPNWALLGLVALVNVLFLVLVFFALSTRFVIQPGVAVSVPFSPFQLAPERNSQIVSITAGPSPVIFFQDEKVTIDAFAAKIGEVSPVGRTLIVKADRATPFETVATVMNQALKLGFSVVLAGSEASKP